MSHNKGARNEAISKGEKLYFTGNPCKYGHIDRRRVSNGACLTCELEKNRRDQENYPDRQRAYHAKSYAKHKEERRERARQYRLLNPEKVKQASQKSRRTEKSRANKAINQRLRDQAVKRATPSWITKNDMDQIKGFYRFSCHTKGFSGTQTAVDHQIPIKGKNVCGLNVPWNLMVVSQKYNSEKSNKLLDDLPLREAVNSVLIHTSALPWNIGDNP